MNFPFGQQPACISPVRSSLVCFTLLLLAACGGGSSPGGQSSNDQQPSGPDTPAERAELILKATTALPPGQSGFISSTGQTNGMATDEPSDYGEHLDDQREMYWSFMSKDGLFHKEGTPISPKEGVEIYLDEFGVPAVYADNIGDAWFGGGYIIASQRLFLMDAVRRLGKGNFAELTGCGSIAADLMQRTLSYTQAEYQTFFDELHPDSQASILGYRDGANAWLAEVRNDPNKLPAEYGLLTTTAQQIPDFTFDDLLAAGVFITRSVATDGGTEWQNIRALRALEAQFGQAEGRQAFFDLNWFEDAQAASTIPRSVATFSNHPVAASGREAVFNAAADYATALPDTLEHGPGTGVVTLPAECAGSPDALFSGLGGPQGNTGTGGGSASANDAESTKLIEGLAKNSDNVPEGDAAAAESANTAPEVGKKPVPANPSFTADMVANAVQSVQNWGAGLHGGSYMVVMRDPLTENGSTLMINGPQLGYSYPSQLVEIEIHGGEYNARGSTVPALPAVGIGYNEDVAWGITTGYSKTIDSFIDTICSTDQIAAGTCAADQFFHNGQWQDMSCRIETINYRLASMGAPVGPASQSITPKVCRTVHGPIVARDDAVGLARSVSYAMWMKELRNIDPIREWSRSTSFAEINATVKDLTWNENLMVASKDGNIAFYHPGLYPQRSAQTDQRLPIPGEGDQDFTGTLPFSAMPKIINPAQGFVANWNNKPAHGWLGGEGISSHSRPGGSRERVSVIQDLVSARDNWDFASLQELDKQLGTIDPKATAYLPNMIAFAVRQNETLSDRQRGALLKIVNWDGGFYDFALDINDEEAKALPPTTIFTYWVQAIRDELFAPLKMMQLDGFQTPDDSDDDRSVFDRQAGVGNHVFDMSVLDNLAIRILQPSSSSLNVRYDWAGGRDADTILATTLNTALDRLETDFASTNPDDFQRTHPRSPICSLTGGVIGPCITMPYQDRGSWNQIIGWEPADE